MGETDSPGRDPYEDVGPLLDKIPWYKPLLVRVGIGYRYKPTIIFSVLWVATEEIILLLGGVPPLVVFTDSGHILVPVAVIFSAYIMRYMINWFCRSFNLLKARDDDPEHGMGKMFPKTEAFEKYRKEVVRRIFTRKELLFSLIAVPGVINLAQPWAWQWALHGGLDYLGRYLNEFTAISAWVDLFWLATAYCFVGAGMWVILGIMWSIRSLGKVVIPKGRREGRQHVDTTTSEELSDPQKLSLFWRFYESVTEIGKFMYSLCLRFILAGFIYVSIVILGDLLKNPLGQVSPTGTLASIGVLSVAFGLFVFPQLSIHNALVRYKEQASLVVHDLQRELETSFVKALDRLESLGEEKSKWKTKQELWEDSRIIDETVKHVDSVGTWSFRFPSVLKLLGAALVPLITVIGQALLSGILNPLLPV
nr:hypothetical protein [Candidatus Njordarchaeum guaymaensis]